MIYKGYEAKVKFDDKAEIFHGDVVNTKDVITFQGTSVKELERAFHESVDDYLEFCTSRGEEPEKPISGKLLVRMSPELHRRVRADARIEGKSLNAYIVEAIRDRASKLKKVKTASR